jgi:type IV secretory pathway TraG/TraD family ATPase VirD4
MTGTDDEATLVVGGLVALIVLAMASVAAAELAHLAGAGAQPPASPATLALHLAHGTFVWTATATVFAVLEGVILAALAVAAAVGLYRWRAGASHIDRRARRLVRDNTGLRRYTDPAAGPEHLSSLGLGPTIGTVVGTKLKLHLTYEDVCVCVAGARTGKTSSQVIPAVVSAPGACYTTSNKSDVVDATRDARAKAGPVWIFDPQKLTGEDTVPAMWWDPLDLAPDLAGAMMLAGVFASASRPPGSSMDSYFDPEGEQLLGLMLLAAALDGRPITDVYVWLTPRGQPDEEPAQILAKRGQALASAGVHAVIDQPERQRAGVYGTAKKMVAFLADPVLAVWAVPPAADGVARFDCARFVGSSETLYSLSKEGPGSAGPLTAALTAGVLQAAERLAAASPGGRLPVPLLAVLDEVANVARMRELPSAASHYGSRAIVLMAYFQSWSQGTEAFSKEGMAKFWSSANVRVLGGGVTERAFLEDIQAICGHWDAPARSMSSQRYGRSVTSSTRRQPILEVDTLASLPSGRAVVLLSSTRPVVVATEPWQRP